MVEPFPKFQSVSEFPQKYKESHADVILNTAQYPLDIGRKHASSSNALTLSVDGQGQVDYTAIAKRGHSDNRIVHASFKDLYVRHTLPCQKDTDCCHRIPLRHQANAGQISLARPSEEEVAETKRKTEAALAVLVQGAQAAQKPKNTVIPGKRDATFVRYVLMYL